MYNQQQGQYTPFQWQQIQQQQWQQMQQQQQMQQTNQVQNNQYTQQSQPDGYVKKQGCGCGSGRRTTR